MRNALSPSTSNIFAVTGNAVQKRFRYYWRKRPQNKERALLMQVTMPRVSTNKHKLQEFETTIEHQEDKLYGIDLILEKEVKEILKTSPMLIPCLYTQPALADEYFYTRYELKQKGMNMTRIPAHVMEHVLADSKYKHMSVLCQTQTALIYGEPNLQAMFEITKKNKYLCVQGGMYYDRFLTIDELKSYSTLPSIEQLHGELLGTLSSQLSSTYHLLQNPINGLAHSLKERQRNLEEEEEGDK